MPFSIASIDFYPPHILSGSPDKHIRLINITGKGWSTSKELDGRPSPDGYTTPEADPKLVTCVDEEYMSPSISGMCKACGRGVLSAGARRTIPGQAGMLRFKRYTNSHTGLARSGCMNEEWIFSGSYDSTMKVWNRKTGAFIGDLTGGHTGRVFDVGFDCTKIVSGGEVQVRSPCHSNWTILINSQDSASASGILHMASIHNSSNYNITSYDLEGRPAEVLYFRGKKKTPNPSWMLEPRFQKLVDRTDDECVSSYIFIGQRVLTSIFQWTGYLYGIHGTPQREIHRIES